MESFRRPSAPACFRAVREPIHGYFDHDVHSTHRQFEQRLPGKHTEHVHSSAINSATKRSRVMNADEAGARRSIGLATVWRA